MVRRVIIALILVVAMATPTLACSSFAVYSTHGPVFGMNFDLPSRDETNYSSIGYFGDLPMKIMITSRPGVKTFGLGSNAFTLNPFYNEFGVFGTAQAVYPPVFISHSPEPIMSLALVMLAGVHGRSTKDVIDRAQGAQLFIPSPTGEMQIGSHWLFADLAGEAVIIEPGVEENHFLSMTDNQYLVMTNFLNHQLGSAPRIIIALDFDKRYRTAEQMIKASYHNFGPHEALDVLEAVKQTITKFSFVVVPKEEAVYMAVLGDFSRLWKISLTKKTIATFKGFQQERCESLGEAGFSLEDLLGWE